MRIRTSLATAILGLALLALPSIAIAQDLEDHQVSAEDPTLSCDLWLDPSSDGLSRVTWETTGASALDITLLESPFEASGSRDIEGLEDNTPIILTARNGDSVNVRCEVSHLVVASSGSISTGSGPGGSHEDPCVPTDPKNGKEHGKEKPSEECPPPEECPKEMKDRHHQNDDCPEPPKPCDENKGFMGHGGDDCHEPCEEPGILGHGHDDCPEPPKPCDDKSFLGHHDDCEPGHKPPYHDDPKNPKDPHDSNDSSGGGGIIPKVLDIL